MKSRRWRLFISRVICFLIAVIILGLTTPIAQARVLSEKYRDLFSASDIVFWDPEEKHDCDGTDVTWIGDSISYLANGGSSNVADLTNVARSGGGYGTATGGDIGGYFPNAYIDAFPGRRFWTHYAGSDWGGQSALQAAADSGNIRDTIVYALGGNDGTNVGGYANAANQDVHGLNPAEVDAFKAMVDSFGGEHKVVLVTYYAYDETTKQEDYFKETNSVIKQKAKEYGWTVADWAAVATPDDVIGGAHNEDGGTWDVHPNTLGLTKWTSVMQQAICGNPKCISPGFTSDGGNVSIDPIVSSGSVLTALTDLINTYGEYAMSMQRSKGIPWETVFAQAVVESGVGTGASGVHKSAQYNYVGMSDPTGDVSALSGMQPYTSSSGRKWAQFGSIQKLIDGWGYWFIDKNTSRYSAGVQQYLSNYRSMDQLYEWIKFYLPNYSPAEDNNNTEAMIKTVAGLILPGGSIYQIIENNPNLLHSWELGGGTGEETCLTEDVDPSSFIVYAQCDSRWGSLRYGSGGINGNTGGTICSSGCGPTSFATIATNIKGSAITPDLTADVAGLGGMYVTGTGSSWAITQFLANKYSLQYSALSVSAGTAVSTISQYLQNGWMVHTSGKGSAPFTTGGHYIAIVGIAEDGKWLVANSVGQGSLTYYDPQTVVSAGMSLSNVKAVK